MGLLTRLLTLPLTGPAAGAWWVAQKLHEAALAEYTDPAMIRARLEAMEVELEAGRMDEATFEAEERDLLTRLGLIEGAAR